MGAAGTPRAAGELRPGQRLGKYEVAEPLAAGGMAELYLARGRGLDGFEKLVVLKRVLPNLARDQEFVDMFLDEARLAATLDHPNIAHVMDIGRSDGEYFFAMEYVHGRDLRSTLREAAKNGGLPLDCALAIVTQAAAGLHYAHERRDASGGLLGIVHRDVSPSNVLVSYDGGVKVIDFGIAKVTARDRTTRVGVRKGKIGYMSPEQCLGYPLDRRSDVFNLGILLFEATTMHRLFGHDNEFVVMNRITRADVPPPTRLCRDYPEPLAGIVTRALAREPDARYATAHELQIELEEWARAAGLRISPSVIAMEMDRLFGRVPHPSVSIAKAVDDPVELEVATSIATRVQRPRRWWSAAALVAIAAVGGALAGASVFGRGSAPVGASPAPSPASASAVPATIPVPVSIVGASAQSSDAAIVPAAAPAPDPAPAKDTRAPAHSRKKSRRAAVPVKSPTRTTTADSKALDLLAPSQRGR